MPGARKIVAVAGRSIGVFNLGGKFFALRNSCPHQGAPLCTGRLASFLTAMVPGAYEYSRAGEILRCPWHGWEFDVRTGQSWFDPAKVRVRQYAVTVEPDAEVAAASTTSPPAPGLEPGPYIAESYAVTVERRNVVIEIP